MRKSELKLGAPTFFAEFLTILTVLSGLLLSSPKASADNTGNLDTSVSVTAACSLSVDDTSHSASVIPGNNVAIGTSTVTAICNDPSGLAVYMVGYTGSQYGNTNLTATINETTQTIATGNAGSPSNSQWNMTLAAVTGTYAPEIVSGYTSAQPIPSQYTKVAYRNTMTDAGLTATGANFTATFNAYVSMTQPAGTYTGKVKVLLVHPNVLTYDVQTGQPATFAPNTLDSDPEAPIGGCSANSLILQNVSVWGNEVAIGQTIDAIDSRDRQCYKVKRLKMNAAGTETALWMSNLNLGAESLVVNELNSSNTHLASGVSAIQTGTFNSWIKSSSSVSYTDPELIPITASNSVTGSSTDSYGNKYGTLYNYAAASAGTYTYAAGAGTGDATSDLCPAGWRMPTGGSAGELKKISVDAYNIYANYQWNTDGFADMQQSLGFSLAGNFGYYGALRDQGSSGGYWSSTFVSEPGPDMRGYSMFDLYFDNTILGQTYYSRDVGESIRCIAQ